jgi:hypothetical protein
MNRAYDTPVYYRHSSQRIKIRCYKIKRADGSETTSIYSHYLGSAEKFILHCILKVCQIFILNKWKKIRIDGTKYVHLPCFILNSEAARNPEGI